MSRPPLRFILPFLSLVLLILVIGGILLLRRRATRDLVPTSPLGVSIPASPASAVQGISSQVSTTGGVLEYVEPSKKAAPARAIPQADLVQVSASTSSDVPSLSTTSTVPLRLNIDSDADGVSDQDETGSYRTDPQKPDTDGDTYPDGEEIEKGYNPLGPGKCADPSCLLSP